MDRIENSKGIYFDLYFILLNLTIIFIIYVILMNLFLIIAILMDPNMRGRLFFKLILLIAVAHFLQGLLVIPLHVESGISEGKWTSDQDICTFWHLTDLTLTVVLTILFLMLMFERFFSLTYPQIVKNRCLGLLMLLSPWLLSTSFVVFLNYVLHSNLFQTEVEISVTHEHVTKCRFDEYAQGIYSLFGFLSPAVFVFGFSWANVVILCFLRRRYAEGPSEENPRSHTSTASLVALCFIAMWFPANSAMFLPMEISRFVSITTALYLGFANAALTPSLWLILPMVKRGFRRLCCCCCIACCGSFHDHRHHGTFVSSAVDESQIRMLGQERVQPSVTTKL